MASCCTLHCVANKFLTCGTPGVQVVSGAEQAAAAEAGAGGELLGAFNVATFAGEVGTLTAASETDFEKAGQ